jgi:uncharacterized membrane protein
MPNSTGVSIESRSFSVIPGETVQTTAIIHNSSNNTGQFIFRVDGLESDWYNLPVSSTTLFPNDEEKLVILFHPPKTDKVKAGLYPFHFIIDCQDSPGDAEHLEMMLEIKEIPEINLDITPERISGKKGSYNIIVSNPATTAATVRLNVVDRDSLLRCNLHPSVITVPAGESAESTLMVQLKWLHYFHRRKAYHFTVSGQQTGSDSVKSVAGQLYKMPWRIHFPFRLSLPSRIRVSRRPPDISRFEATTEDKRRFRLVWSVENAVEVKLNEISVEPRGEKDIYPAETTSYVLTSTNKHGSVSRTVFVEPIVIPEERYSERILVLMTPNKIQVAAGSESIEATLDIQNIGSIVDKFSLEIEGLAESWYSLSASSVALMPRASEQVQIFFHPPKVKGVVSDNYTFAVTLRSQSIPEDSTSITAQLEILPSVDYSIALKPYRTRCRRKRTINVQIDNKDVTESELFIDVIDAENSLRFKLENDSPVVPPWQTVEIPMLVRPKRNSIVGDLKRYDINLTATTADGYTQLARGQIDHKPLLSSWRPVFRTVKYIIVISAVGFIIYYLIRLGGGWGSLVRDPQTWLDGTIRHIRGWFY